MNPPERCPRCRARRGAEGCAACQIGAALSPPRAPDLAGESFGPFAIQGLLGQGGMGVVYEAIDTRPTSPRCGHRVALKILSADLDAPERVVREAQIVAALEHEHIVPVYEVGEHEGIPYFTMKRVDGGALRTPAESPRRAAEIAREIADAVALAHRHGILHRDLKPMNVLVDRSGRAFVTDFGVASREDLLGSSAGTPCYMAPEVLRGEPGAATTMADVWGAGVLLYELLAGHPPFEADDEEVLVRRILGDPPAPLDGAPPDLAAVCLHCLEKDPSRRYTSGAELAADLERFLADEPVRVRPRGRAERAARWCRHHPVIAALSVLLVMALGTTAWSALARSRAKQEAFQSELARFHAEQAAFRAADFAARRAADLTALHFERLTAVVEGAGRDPRVVAAAVAEPGSPLASDVCEALLAERAARPGVPFSTWFLVDTAGLAVGHAPPSNTIGRRYAFRDYFRGAEELARHGEQKAHVSRAYRSEADGNYSIAISFPVRDGERWVGTLAASLFTGSALGSIELDDPAAEELTAALVAPRDRERDPGGLELEPIYILRRTLGRGEAVPAGHDDILGTGPGSAAFVRVAPVRSTPFSVLVRVALDRAPVAAASAMRGSP